MNRAKDRVLDDYYLGIEGFRVRHMVESYLDEKGGMYKTMDIWKDQGVYRWSIRLVDVPVRLYHEVVVPGLIELCKKRRIAFLPFDYAVYPETRSISLVFSVRRN